MLECHRSHEGLEVPRHLDGQAIAEFADSASFSPTESVLVSDVVAVADATTFTLAIDTADIESAAYHYIHIILFVDLDATGTVTTGDQWDYTEPTATDTVFGSQSWAYYYYYENPTDYNDAGWNIYYSGTGSEDVAGAVLEMYSSFSTVS